MDSTSGHWVFLIMAYAKQGKLYLNSSLLCSTILFVVGSRKEIWDHCVKWNVWGMKHKVIWIWICHHLLGLYLRSLSKRFVIFRYLAKTHYAFSSCLKRKRWWCLLVSRARSHSSGNLIQTWTNANGRAHCLRESTWYDAIFALSQNNSDEDQRIQIEQAIMGERGQQPTTKFEVLSQFSPVSLILSYFKTLDPSISTASCQLKCHTAIFWGEVKPVPIHI